MPAPPAPFGGRTVAPSAAQFSGRRSWTAVRSSVCVTVQRRSMRLNLRSTTPSSMPIFLRMRATSLWQHIPVTISSVTTKACGGAASLRVASMRAYGGGVASVVSNSADCEHCFVTCRPSVLPIFLRVCACACASNAHVWVGGSEGRRNSWHGHLHDTSISLSFSLLVSGDVPLYLAASP